MAATPTSQHRPNKVLHPTAYSFGFPLVPRSKPSLPAAGELNRSVAARGLVTGAGAKWCGKITKVMYKELFSTLAVIVTFALFVPYIRSIQRGETKPHVFSWAIWGLGTLIVFFAQLAGGGGLGAWVIGISGLISSYIALLAYLKRGDTVITKTDWMFFGAALCALPCWFFTSNPLWAVVTLTLVDLFGFGPTIRKAYARPHEESAGFFALSFGRNLLVILALEHYSITTVLFPAAIGFACLLVAFLLAYRKRLVAAT